MGAIVVDIYEYLHDPPHEPSAGLKKWLPKLQAGWRPNKRIRSLGYSMACDFYGVYCWELFNVIYKFTSPDTRGSLIENGIIKSD